ncbi:D-specific alpha-keto acid dehydrogenase [Amycolatopsis thermoflava]|uniref:D-specific alpha-keto acid dehydrogenase n=2 Tax=Amycolatopsis thermoflava TaxID=84480 RepID=A0A3N2H7T9_9PSEU|nr:D-specific alpha-keto acid dehydrogenase [Amycolatopsis thermoflava]
MASSELGLRRGETRAGTEPRPSHRAGLTAFGCSRDEAAAFRDMGARLGMPVTPVEAAVCAANAELARGHRCVSVSHKTRITGATLLALSRAGVEYICTRSIGFDHIDLRCAERLGMSVGNVAYSPDSVADYTLMLMLMAVRHAKTTIHRTDSFDYRLSETRGKELRDLTVGVVGTGRIGAAVVDRLRGFGCRVLAHDTHPRASATYVPLDDLIERSDIVTLHTPLTAETHHLLDRRRIERMKPGAYVVNTGRGPLLDTAALLSALENGQLGGAALDVVEGEEGIFYADCRGKHIGNEALARLQRLPNVLISPHSAYHTERALHDIVENTLLNCLNFESGTTA